MFWFWMVLLSAVAVLFVVLPLITNARKNARVEAVDAEILRNQLAELEQDLNEATISEEVYAQAKVDLERAYLQNTSEGEIRQVNLKASPLFALGLMIIIPVAGWLIYQQVGMPEADTMALLENVHSSGQAMDAGVMPDIDLMIERVRKRVTDNPSDVASWSMLARSLYSLGRLDEALIAFQGAIDNGLHDPDSYAEFADLMAHRRGSLGMHDEAFAYIQKALELDPNHITALWLAGTAARNDGDLAMTLQYWTKLEGVLPEGSEIRAVIEGNIAAVRTQMQ